MGIFFTLNFSLKNFIEIFQRLFPFFFKSLNTIFDSRLLFLHLGWFGCPPPQWLFVGPWRWWTLFEEESPIVSFGKLTSCLSCSTADIERVWSAPIFLVLCKDQDALALPHALKKSGIPDLSSRCANRFIFDLSFYSPKLLSLPVRGFF